MEITTLKNNTKMETQIFKHGDFTLKHFDYCDSYFIFYKDIPKWEGEFEELVVDELRFYIFEIEPNRNNAAEFIIKLYDWVFAQPEAFEKIPDELPDEIYEKYKQSKGIK